MNDGGIYLRKVMLRLSLAHTFKTDTENILTVFEKVTSNEAEAAQMTV